MPMLDPARAGLTKTGRPSRSRSAARQRAARPEHRVRPDRQPLGAQQLLGELLVHRRRARRSTPEPTYGTPAISSRPWMVPSSPYGPCRTGNTTSTPRSAPRALGRLDHDQPAGGRVAGQHHGGARVHRGQLAAADAAARAGSPPASTQRPSGVMPTGTTSYSSRSSAASTLPALTQEMACSVLRPPNTTATRTLRADMRGTLPGRRDLPARPLSVVSRPESRPARMSATRSAVSSQPAESRTSPAGTSSPHWARRSAVVCSPPKLVAATTSRVAAKNAATAAAEGSSKVTTPPKRRICRAASAYPGWSGSPGWRTARRDRVLLQQRGQRQRVGRLPAPAAGPEWTASGAPARPPRARRSRRSASARPAARPAGRGR